MAYDLLIKNGRVVDGSGEPWFYADVAVTNGQIVGVGKFNETAARTINADGLVVAPGFIDHHTHFDPQCMWDPIVKSTSLNGNTSIIVGQCGTTIAPTRPGDGANGTWTFSRKWKASLSDAQRKGSRFRLGVHSRSTSTPLVETAA